MHFTASSWCKIYIKVSIVKHIAINKLQPELLTLPAIPVCVGGGKRRKLSDDGAGGDGYSNKPKCLFCASSHLSENCTQYTSLHKRRARMAV